MNEYKYKDKSESLLMKLWKFMDEPGNLFMNKFKHMNEPVLNHFEKVKTDGWIKKLTRESRFKYRKETLEIKNRCMRRNY